MGTFIRKHSPSLLTFGIYLLIGLFALFVSLGLL